MAAPNPPATGEVDVLFAALEQIERDLASFQNQVVPALKKFGGRLDEWALTIGQNYQQSAQDIYTRVQQRAGAQGAYTYQDLSDLETADQLSRRGEQVRRWGVAIAKTVKFGAWAAGIFSRAQAQVRVIDLIEQEKAHLPQVTALIEMSEEHVRRLLDENEAFFKLSAARVARTPAQRKIIYQGLEQGVRTFQRLSEAHARLDYYRAVYACIAAFDRSRLQESLQKLMQTGVEDRAIYQLQGMSYLRRLDEVLEPLTWQANYYEPGYEHGLPAGVAYFLGEGRHRLPPGASLQALDRDLQRVQQETPKISSPRALYRALRYLRDLVGDISAPFPQQARLARQIGPWLAASLGLALLGLLLYLTGAGAQLSASAQGLAEAFSAWLPLDTALRRFTFGYMLALILGAILYLVWYFGTANRPRR